jgi:tRNA threonylcarbamoyladenosine biosynthesis protein TsaB
MRILSFDSSGRAASVAVLEDKRIISEFFLNSGLTHSQTIAPMADLILRCSGSGDIDLLAASVGPGSFTGIRIGVSLVNGMAAALEKKCVGVSSLRVLAYNAKSFFSEDAVIFSCIHARADEIYFAAFSLESGIPNKIEKDKVIRVCDLKNIAENFDKKIILVGSSAYLCRDYLQKEVNNFDGSKYLICKNEFLAASNVAEAIFDDLFRGLAIDIKSYLEPNYLKDTKAVRENKI